MQRYLVEIGDEEEMVSYRKPFCPSKKYDPCLPACCTVSASPRPAPVATPLRGDIYCENQFEEERKGRIGGVRHGSTAVIAGSLFESKFLFLNYSYINLQERLYIRIKMR